MSRIVITVEFNEKRLSTCQVSEPEQDAAAFLTPVLFLDEAYKTMRMELVAQIKEGGE